MLHNSAMGVARYLHKATMCPDVVRIETTDKGVTIEIVRDVTTNMGQGVTTMTTNNRRDALAFG
jgi:hypothetical protein